MFRSRSINSVCRALSFGFGYFGCWTQCLSPMLGMISPAQDWQRAKEAQLRRCPWAVRKLLAAWKIFLVGLESQSIACNLESCRCFSKVSHWRDIRQWPTYSFQSILASNGSGWAYSDAYFTPCSESFAQGIASSRETWSQCLGGFTNFGMPTTQYTVSSNDWSCHLVYGNWSGWKYVSRCHVLEQTLCHRVNSTAVRAKCLAKRLTPVSKNKNSAWAPPSRA